VFDEPKPIKASSANILGARDSAMVSENIRFQTSYRRFSPILLGLTLLCTSVAAYCNKLPEFDNCQMRSPGVWPMAATSVNELGSLATFARY
jgi:hypothetical protein